MIFSWFCKKKPMQLTDMKDTLEEREQVEIHENVDR